MATQLQREIGNLKKSILTLALWSKTICGGR